ncbi:MAG: 4a-hydroxytetrahydrobiopterin dehydratase [Merismopedia sp. SIO2A8]|nr:4a-hydroxytetrahydrobiopterin dehydratase [Merismopedia sp. SIO2A8]
MVDLLSSTEIEERAKQLEGWSVEGKKLELTFTFPGFVEAIAFVNKIVEPAEAVQHHPDLAISYNKVTVSLTTHDAGGLSTKDFDLAQTISKLG